jgi:hypothetical protein
MIICIAMLAGGCASNPFVKVVTVDVPVPIPCNIVAPRKPVMPFSDSPFSEDIFVNAKTMVAEIEIRMGYEVQLEAAITACNSK